MKIKVGLAISMYILKYFQKAKWIIKKKKSVAEVCGYVCYKVYMLGSGRRACVFIPQKDAFFGERLWQLMNNNIIDLVHLPGRASLLGQYSYFGKMLIIIPWHLKSLFHKNITITVLSN